MKEKRIKFATLTNNSNLIKKYLSDGYNFSYENNWAIKRASEKGNRELVKILYQDEKVRNSLRKEDITGLIEIEYKLFKLKNGKRL